MIILEFIFGLTAASFMFLAGYNATDQIIAIPFAVLYVFFIYLAYHLTLKRRQKKFEVG